MNHRRKLHERLRCDSNIMLRLRKFRSCKNWRWCTDLSMQYTLSKYKDQNPIRTWLDCVNDLEENWRFNRTQRITMRSQLWREDKFSLTAIDIILKHEYSFWTFWRILTKIFNYSRVLKKVFLSCLRIPIFFLICHKHQNENWGNFVMQYRMQYTWYIWAVHKILSTLKWKYMILFKIIE